MAGIVFTGGYTVARYRVPYLPTDMDLVGQVFRLARLGHDDIFYDLGCGDGRMVIEAVKRAGVRRAVCIEVNEVLARKAWERARRAGVEDRVRIVHGDFFTYPITDATVVYMYLSKRANRLLKPKLERELRLGARVVTLDFEIPGWRPVSVLTRSSFIQNTLYLYVRGVSDAFETALSPFKRPVY